MARPSVQMKSVVTFHIQLPQGWVWQNQLMASSLLVLRQVAVDGTGFAVWRERWLIWAKLVFSKWNWALQSSWYSCVLNCYLVLWSVFFFPVEILDNTFPILQHVSFHLSHFLNFTSSSGRFSDIENDMTLLTSLWHNHDDYFKLHMPF